jgi:predicted DNA-binding mobile mystery protein A
MILLSNNKIMKTNRKQTQSQRQLMDSKLAPFIQLREMVMPLDGWLKAVRGALGLTAAQLAQRMKIQTSGLLQLERREVLKSVTLASLDKAARAMNCRLVWTIVPEKPNDSLNAIVEKRARRIARKLTQSVDQSMKLESQELPAEVSNQQADNLTIDLLRNGDPRIWDEIGEEPF